MTISKQEVFIQLRSLGLTDAQVRAFLPPWMTDEALETESGLAHLKILLVRRFGIDAEELFKRGSVSFRSSPVRYKRSMSVAEEALSPATAITVSAASHALSAFRYEYSGLPSATDLRQQVLDAGAKYVSLNALVGFAAHMGIPVLPIRQLPQGLAKMDGLAVMPNSAPAIAIARRSQFSAWYAFIIAHELGHIFHGHVTSGGLIIDELFDESSFSLQKEDDEENTANAYAFALLGGSISDDDSDLSCLSTPREIAAAAMAAQRLYKVDAGHLILRAAYKTGRWQLFTAALQRLDNDPNRADAILGGGVVRAVDWASLPEESRQFLRYIGGINN